MAHREPPPDDLSWIQFEHVGTSPLAVLAAAAAVVALIATIVALGVATVLLVS